MFLDDFHSKQQQIIAISAEQGSRFAKEVSDDFNPLHNPEHKRFIVPGDLLFALSLHYFGLGQQMKFNFTGMVGKQAELTFPAEASAEMSILNANGKSCMDIQTNGDKVNNAELIEAFTRAYVAFSGHSFPHILVPLMKDNGVMINPDRPMVMYESMAFEFNNLNITDAELQLVNSELDVQGKRGRVKLEFEITADNQVVGQGYKTMMLSGLKEYEQPAIDALIKLYEDSKQSYKNS